MVKKTKVDTGMKIGMRVEGMKNKEKEKFQRKKMKLNKLQNKVNTKTMSQFFRGCGQMLKCWKALLTQISLL